MIILGIDPGINKVGYGIIKLHSNNNIKYLHSSVIKTNAADSLHIRLGIIVREMENVLLEFNPNAIGMEEVFINKNALSSMKLCHARGAIMSIIGKSNIFFEELASTRIKKILTGNGHADKTQVLYMIKMLVHGIKEGITNDESDALAVAYSISLSENLC